jgi:hypothetical protein
MVGLRSACVCRDGSVIAPAGASGLSVQPKGSPPVSTGSPSRRPSTLVVTCGDAARARWAPTLADLGAPVVDLSAIPGRTDVDPLLDRLPGAAAGVPDGPEARLVVAGDDAALAAVVVRLLRRERLELPLALLPAADSPAAAVWGVPTDPAAAVVLARDGRARPAPLVRDDHGGVVVGRHATGPFRGVVYCDEHLVADGATTGLAVAPDPDVGVTVRVTGPRRLAGLRAGRVATCAGRAVQLGCRPAVDVTRDGLPGDRPVSRRSWYRHTADWHLVRP